MAERFLRVIQRVREFFRWFYRYRSIRLTAEGVRFLLLTLAIGIAALNTGNNLLYLLLAMMLSLIVMSGILSEQTFKQVTIRRRTPDHIFAGRPATATLCVINRKPRFPTFSLRVMDLIEGHAVDRGVHLLHVPPQGTAIRAYPIRYSRRGLHRIEGIKLLTRFPFGLFIKAATLPLETDLVVYPEIKPLPEVLVRDLASLGSEQAVPRRGEGAGLYNLREYQEGDNSRAIHWKTSARQARLIVRETETEDQRHVTLALPTAGPGDHQEAFERAVVLGASLAQHFHDRGFSVRLLVGDREIPHGIGESHFHRVLRALALCDPTPGAQSAPLPEGFLTLGDRTALGEVTMLILPWPDPRLTAACGGVSRVVKAWEEAGSRP
jgi:uncharacterized protein (DUF58 family)